MNSVYETMNMNYETSNNPVATAIGLVIVVVLLIALWKIYEKGGEKGWKALIPFYNVYIEFKLFWGNGWMFLLTLIPIVNVVVQIMLLHKMSKAFGHGIGFTLGLIFLPYIFLAILGFNSDEYLGPQ